MMSSMSLEHRFEQVLAEFLQAEERGERPEPSDLLRTNPELETQLRDYFRDRFIQTLAVILPYERPKLSVTATTSIPLYDLLEERRRKGKVIEHDPDPPAA